MNPIIAHIRSVQKLSSAAESALMEKLRTENLPKGSFLTKESQICHRLYFISQGCLRGYYLKDGREVTHWFAFENDFVTSFYSFITQRPAVESIQLMEDCELFSISKNDLDLLCNDFPEIERVLRLSYENYYIRLEEKYVNNQFKTAAQRYQELMDTRPHFLQRIPLKHIASFLGISNETLSRIRSKTI